MIGSTTPAEPLAAVLLEATRELTRAAAAGDADAIDRAVAARGAAVEGLAVVLAAGGEVDADSRGRVLAAIAIETDAASQALRALVEIVRGELTTLAEGAQASRGYASPAGLGFLDRAG